MSIGETMAQAREGKYTQEQLAFELNYSREAISKFETGSRQIPEELRPTLSQKLDDPVFYMEMKLKATGGVGIPYLDGDYIDKHPASLKDLVQKETNEALDHLERACMIKPISARTAQEKQEMWKVLHELLDSVASMKNLVAVMCKEYGFSMKELDDSWKATLIARKWKRRKEGR